MTCDRCARQGCCVLRKDYGGLLCAKFMFYCHLRSLFVVLFSPLVKSNSFQMGAACCNGESFSTEASQAHLRRNRRKSQQPFALQHTSHPHTTVSTSPSHASPRAMSSATDASSANFVEITTVTGGSGTSWPAVKIIAQRATNEMEECPATVCPARLFQSAHQPVTSVTATHLTHSKPLVRPGFECPLRQNGCDAAADKEDPPAVVLRMLPFEGAVGGEMNTTQVLPSPPGEFSTTAAPVHQNRPTEATGKVDDESSTIAPWSRAAGSLLLDQPLALHAMSDAFGDALRRFCSDSTLSSKKSGVVTSPLSPH